jgi:histone acetyltransferase 1
MANWTSDANHALTLSLVRSVKDTKSLSEAETYTNFHPMFTYPIYGDDEKIYGYNDLVVDLRFASGSLHQYLNIKHTAKIPSTETIDDPEATLAEFIPPDYYTKEDEFMACVEKQATEFRPAGQRIYSYTRSMKGKGPSGSEPSTSSNEDIVEFEVYHTTWSTPGFREYHRRMQLFILLYIEGGSYIQEDEDPWEFFVLYEKRKCKDDPSMETYHFVGYSSLYPFYCFPERVRMRLSQFIILPPYQRYGHGSELYKAIYQYTLSQPNFAELTVEDPAEAFEDLRDKNDLTMLFGHTKFMEEAFGNESSAGISHGGGRVGGVGKAKRSGKGGEAASASGKGKIGPPVDKKWAEKWRMDLKIAGRQFQRLIEMIILSKLDPLDVAGMKAYRLQVKERLYRFNFETLAQLEKPERLEKLEETFHSVTEDYGRILALVL